jgi:hypothetical protein
MGRMRSGHAGCRPGSRASRAGVSPGAGNQAGAGPRRFAVVHANAQSSTPPLLRHPAGPAGEGFGPAYRRVTVSYVSTTLLRAHSLGPRQAGRG